MSNDDDDEVPAVVQNARKGLRAVPVRRRDDSDDEDDDERPMKAAIAADVGCTPTHNAEDDIKFVRGYLAMRMKFAKSSKLRAAMEAFERLVKNGILSPPARPVPTVMSKGRIVGHITDIVFAGHVKPEEPPAPRYYGPAITNFKDIRQRMLALGIEPW